jgi:hypothetical protein|tara:strand:+ start:1506 stop:1670 length:165 start_codon:yes stop_codon:yes gene_type:complete
MKSNEDKMVNAFFRADMIKRNNSDPGSDWNGDSWFGTIVFVIFGFLLFKSLLSS